MPTTSKEVNDEARLAALAAYGILDTEAEREFDDIVEIAAEICGAPVSLISLLDADRQWFKAETGFGQSETPLEQSICRYTANLQHVLVVPDATRDPRTAANALVTDDPHVRFYAGAPLVTPEGVHIGALCVLDTRPRGLTDAQASALKALARQVMGQLELRRAVREREAAAEQERQAAEAQRRSEERWRGIFETLQEGFSLGTVVRDATGRIVDWRYDELNAAWGKFVGVDHRSLLGRTIREAFPGIEDKWVDDLAGVVDTGVPHRFTDRVALLGRWYEGVAQPAGGETFTTIFLDITARVEAERRQEALVALGDKLQGAATSAEVVASAAAVLGTTLRASRAGYSLIDKAAGEIVVEGDWTTPGVVSIQGRHPLAGLRASMEHMAGGGSVVVANLDGASWLGRDLEAYRRLGVRAQLMVPSLDRGELAGLVFVHQAEPRTWNKDEVTFAHAVADRTYAALERIRAEERLRDSEAHWRGLFARLSEGFLVGEVVRDADGRATDWRYVEVNRAWGDLVGIDPATVIGRTLREVVPGVEDEWVDEWVQVAETGRSVAFTRQVGAFGRWYEGRAFPLETDRFGAIFLEVTDRIQAEVRRAALLSLGDRLRDLTSVPEMTRAASEIVGRTLGATRAGFGRIEGDVEAIEIELDWTAPGTASIAGRHVFEDYGDIRGHLRRGEPLVIEDVWTDSRTASDPGAMLALGIGALVNMPVRERGRTVAVFIAHDMTARRWTPEELAFLRNVADRVEVGVARVRAEELQAVLNGELAHRLKNTLALVQSIASQTLRDVSEQDLVEAFTRRVLALSRAHDVLLQKSWAAARMRSVMEGVLALQASLDRFALEGPDMDLTPQAALSLTLLLHELATNAVKYGALSADTGTVHISWRTEDRGSPSLVLDWAEAGGPAAVAPTGRGGFGSKLIRMGLMGSRKADIRYGTSGLRAEFRAPLSELQAQVQ